MVRKILVMAVLAAASAAAGSQLLHNVPVRVQVLDATGQPVSGGKVHFASDREGKPVKDGRAEDVRDELRSGLYKVAYAREGLLAVRRIRVRETDQALTATIRLGKEPVARGRVVTRDGTPIPNATVDVGRVGRLLTVDAQGQFRIDGLCLEGDRVQAWARGYIRSAAEHLVGRFPVCVEFTLIPQAAITVVITDVYGKPIPDARYQVHLTVAGQGQIRGSGPMDAEHGGPSDEMDGLPPGEVSLVAYGPYHEIQGQKIRIEEGERGREVRFRLEPVATAPVRGVVVGPDGRTPVHEAEVGIESNMEREHTVRRLLVGEAHGPDGLGSPSPYRASSDPRGRFEVEVPLGTYSGIEAHADGYLRHRSGPLEVEGPVSGLRLQLWRGGRVEGTVRAPDGSLPSPGTEARMQVRVGEHSFTELTAQVDPNTGRFAFERVWPGRSELTVAFPDHASATATVEVIEGKVARPALRFLPEVKIAGKVVDRRNGSPIAMARVGADRLTGPEDRRAVTEADGTFDLPAMTAGQIRVWTTRPGYASVRQSLDASGGGLYEVTLETSPGGRVEGQLSQAILAAIERPIWISLEGYRVSHEADGKGRFVFPNLLPGTYTVKARGPAGQPAAKPAEITVREGQVTRVVLEAP